MVTNMLYGGPFRDMRLLQEEVNRLAQSAAAPQATFPAINVYAHQDGIVITAELPGVQQDDLEITVHRDTVTLRGERQDSRTMLGLIIVESVVVALSSAPSDFRFRLIPTKWMQS